MWRGPICKQHLTAAVAAAPAAGRSRASCRPRCCASAWRPSQSAAGSAAPQSQEQRIQLFQAPVHACAAGGIRRVDVRSWQTQ